MHSTQHDDHDIYFPVPDGNCAVEQWSHAHVPKLFVYSTQLVLAQEGTYTPKAWGWHDTLLLTVASGRTCQQLVYVL